MLELVTGQNPVYLLFGGPISAGKSTWAKMHLAGKIDIADQDDIKKALNADDPDDTGNVSRSLHIKNSRVDMRLHSKESIADMGTMSGLKAAENKVRKAKDAGFTVVIVFVTTDPETAVQRNRERLAAGGHGVPPEKEGKIYASHTSSNETFAALKKNPNVDYWLSVTT